MKVRVHWPQGSEGWTEDVDLPAVPAVGHLIEGPDRREYAVRHVVWYPWGINGEPHTDDDPLIYVVVKR